MRKVSPVRCRRRRRVEPPGEQMRQRHAGVDAKHLRMAAEIAGAVFLAVQICRTARRAAATTALLEA
jgi:hypothetical protein